MLKTLNNSKQILVAPLDWGLGHASRCIPVIQTCLDLGHSVTLAGEGPSLKLLQEAFPGLKALILKGYRVRYTSSPGMLPLKMITQLPRLLHTIRYEHRWLKRILQQHHFDLVISDNRYGLFNTTLPCLFMTHQVQIRIPQSRWLQDKVNGINRWLIRKFTACLLPDYPGPASMAGELSHSGGLPRVYYLGNLSRFKQALQQELPLKYDLLVLLSGPEPQRAMLEQIIREQAIAMPVNIMLVLGKPGDGKSTVREGRLTIRSHVAANELQQLITQSAMVIARAGFSTVMDLIKLNKHAILIPTPGQTEQEYLGHYLSGKKWFGVYEQDNIHLPRLVQEYKQMSFAPFPGWDLNLYHSVLQEVLTKHA